MLELGVFHSTEDLGTGRRTDARTANDLETLVGVDVPDSDSAVAGSGDDLLLVELNTVDGVGVAGQVDTFAALVTASPVLVDTSSCVVHQFPMLHGLVGDTGTSTTDLDGSRRHVSLLLVLLQILSAPDKRILGDARPALSDTLGSLQTFGVKVGENESDNLGGKCFDRIGAFGGWGNDLCNISHLNIQVGVGGKISATVAGSGDASDTTTVKIACRLVLGNEGAAI